MRTKSQLSAGKSICFVCKKHNYLIAKTNIHTVIWHEHLTLLTKDCRCDTDTLYLGYKDYVKGFSSMNLDLEKATKIAELHLDYLQKFNQVFFNHSEIAEGKVEPSDFKEFPDGWLFRVKNPEESLTTNIRYICVPKRAHPFRPAPDMDVESANSVEEIDRATKSSIEAHKRASETGTQVDYGTVDDIANHLK